MRYLFVLVLAACIGPVQAQVVGERDPLVLGNLYLDLARAGERVVAVGDRGLIVYSDDEGRSWQLADSPTGVLLTAVCFADSQTGWAVGHDAVVLGTRDGGVTWELQYSDELVVGDDLDDDYADDYYDDDYYDDDYDIYAYDDDMGEHAAVDTSGAPLLNLWCESEQRAVAVGGYGYVVMTRDGGDSWQRSKDWVDNPEGWHLYDITAIDGSPDTLVMVGEQGKIYRSLDRGNNWEALESPYHGTFFGAVSSNSSTLLVFGLQGNIWLSRDRGDSWERIASGVTSGLNDGAVLADGSIVLVGNAGAVLVSRDQGDMFSLRFQPDRRSISAVLPRRGGGVLVAGASGIRILENLR